MYCVKYCIPSMNSNGKRMRASQILQPFYQRMKMMRYKRAIQVTAMIVMIL